METGADSVRRKDLSFIDCSIFFLSIILLQSYPSWSFCLTARTPRNKNFVRVNLCLLEAKSSTVDAATSSSVYDSVIGLYRPFADLACEKLRATGWVTELSTEIEPDLRETWAVAKGGQANNTIVRLTTRTFVASNDKSPIRFARYGLLETISPSSSSSSLPQTKGSQVLNFVIFPSQATTLPVWGVDLVSLPPGKHLLLLDAQPMIPSSSSQSYDMYWSDWYRCHVESQFAWGGDLPAEIQRFVSPYALWTRMYANAVGQTSNLFNETQNSNVFDLDPLQRVQGPIKAAFLDHLDIYLKVLGKHKDDTGRNDQNDYILYRLNNDPARPMLKSLYGEEYTERLLKTVLFPKYDHDY